jgi:hypothetical protein
MKLFPCKRIPSHDGTSLEIQDGSTHALYHFGAGERSRPGLVKKVLQQMLWSLQKHRELVGKKLLETAGDPDDREATNLNR